ncbi:hypothetical protein [Rhizobium leguminosarum]|uniref:hypothetical protein n=1 Tax=Rhizobium leguminosarum TaxID=384 RepID=UPI001FDF1148|nr:hypothetical protein [Rhizobium leguminosarum]
MSGSSGEKHPFLDDLADDAELRGTILRRPVSGRDNIKRLVEAGAAHLLRRDRSAPLPAIQGNTSLRPLDLEAVGVIERDETGLVRRVTMTFAPLDAALSLSAGLGDIVGKGLGDDLFYTASVKRIAAS